MKTKPLIIILVILGLIALVGGYILGTFNDDSLVEKSDNITEETDENNEDEAGSETLHDNITKPDADEEDNKEDALEKEEAYADEENNDDDEEEVSVSSDSPELSMEEGLIVYYPFNEDTKDYSGEEKDATNHGAVFVEGKNGKALNFDGKDDFVYAPVDINPISMPQITITAWVKAKKGSIVVRQIISSGDEENYNRTIGTDFRGGGKGWSCFAGTGKVLGYKPVVADKWTFVASIYDQDINMVKLFVDGYFYEKEGKIDGEGNDFVLIGAQGSIEEQSHRFNGFIDEVKIYDYALSDTELNSLYTTGVARPDSN